MIRSEFLNLRSTSTAWVLLAGSMVMAAASLLANAAVFDASELGSDSSMQALMHSSTVATITFAFVAGLVVSTSDYRFGRIDQLLLSSSRPSRIVANKSVAGSVLGVVYGVLGSAVALSVIALYYRANDVDIVLTSAVVMKPVLGVILAAALFVVAGIGLGSAIRNQPFALGAGLTLLLVVQPPLLVGLPDVGRWFPGAAALAMTLAPDPALLSQAGGTLVLAGWTALAVLVGVMRLGRARG